MPIMWLIEIDIVNSDEENSHERTSSRAACRVHHRRRVDDNRAVRDDIYNYNEDGQRQIRLPSAFNMELKNSNPNGWMN